MGIRKRATGHQILFLVSFFVGIVLVTIMAKGKIPENTLISNTLAGTFLEEGWNHKELLIRCLWNRVAIFVFIMLLTCTTMRIWVCRAILLWTGLVAGILLKLFYLWYGIKGMGLMLAAAMPHYLFYFMGYGLLYHGFERNRLRTRKNHMPVLVAVGVVIIGIVLESYVNPFLVGGYLKIFF